MAAGDFTVTAGTAATAGNRKSITGTAEIDGTRRAFDIFPSGYVVSFEVQGTDDAGAVEVDLNKDASGNDDNGSVTMASSTRNVNTYNWVAVYV